MMKDKIFTVPKICGMAATVPKEIVQLKDLNFSAVAKKNIMAVSGITEVRSAPPDKTVSDYCLNAADTLLAEMNFDKNLIDGVIFAAIDHDYISPGSGFILHDRLSLSDRCIVVDLTQACAGFVQGLFQAFLMIQSGYCKNILLCVGCNQTKLVNPKDKSLKMIMGDCGAACLISAGSSESSFAFYSDGSGLKNLYIPVGGGKFPHKAGVTDIEEVDEQGNTRSAENLFMDGLEVMAFALKSVPIVFEEVLTEMNWQIDDVEFLMLHQANQFMVDSVRKRLHLPVEKVPFKLGKFGNTSLTSIPLALCLQPNNLKKVVFCGFGGGLSAAAVALSLEQTYFSTLQEI